MVDDSAKPARRIVTGRLVRMGADERAFDDGAWRAMPGEQRVGGRRKRCAASWPAREP